VRILFSGFLPKKEKARMPETETGGMKRIFPDCLPDRGEARPGKKGKPSCAAERKPIY
jgi:hypothetical protein